MADLPHPLIVPDLLAGMRDPTFIWPGLTPTGHFWLEQGEQVIWQGSADVSGMRHVSGTVEGDPRRAAWNISAFATCTITDRRILYKGDSLTSGRPWRFSEATAATQSNAQGAALPRLVLGHIRFGWISHLVAQSDRAFAVLPVGAINVICRDELSVIRVRLILAPGMGRISTAAVAFRVSQQIARCAVAARLHSSRSELTAEQVARLTAASAGPDVNENGVHSWDLPGPITIGQNLAVATDPGPVMFQDAKDHFERYRKGNDLADLDRSIGVYRAAANQPNAANLRPRLSGLSKALHKRYDVIGRAQDLHDAIAGCEKALTLMDQHDPDKPEELSNLANMVRHRAELTHSNADFDHAIQLYRDAISAAPEGYRWLADVHGRLSTGFRQRFERTGTPSDIDEAIATGRIALELAQGRGSRIGGQQRTLAEALIIRFHHMGAWNDGTEAEQLLGAAVAATDMDDSRAELLSLLGTVLFYQFEQTGNVELLTEAISAWRGSVKLTMPGDTEEVSAHFGNLANGLVYRYNRFHHQDDLDEAIASYRRALSVVRHGTDNEAKLLTNLAAALERRWEFGRKATDLDEAISLSAAALEACPCRKPHPRW
jgi:tetratricopeptide (TPR) repeat protein